MKIKRPAFALPKNMDFLKSAKAPDAAFAPNKAVMPKSLALNLRMGEISRYFSSNALIERALTSLDKSALLIIGVSWAVALAATGLAYMGVKEASALKVKTETVRALEPVLPKVNRVLLSKEQYMPLTERLKKQFPEVQFEITARPALRIYSNKGEQFIDWLNAVSYTDSMVPSIRWSLVSFCVGTECSGEFIMQAELVAEAINITQPESNP